MQQIPRKAIRGLGGGGGEPGWELKEMKILAKRKGLQSALMTSQEDNQRRASFWAKPWLSGS